jgi:hypothetical protein
MTPNTPKRKCDVVALTHRQIESIIHNLGWEPEDAETFIKMATREMCDPGVLDREEAGCFRQAIQAMDGE